MRSRSSATGDQCDRPRLVQLHRPRHELAASRTIYGYIGNWGLAIILLTMLVRVLLLPFVIPQFRNMAKQRALKPEIDKINELYKDDREKKGAAMMELWRKNKVNPLGGCLPVLLQMPIFFALYQTLSTSIELYHAPFVLVVDRPVVAGSAYYVLPVMLGALMFVQQKLTPIQMDADAGEGDALRDAADDDLLHALASDRPLPCTW